MKHTKVNSLVGQSPYAMLVSSEEKERNLSETAVYMLLILGAVFSIWHVAQQPVNLPVSGLIQTAPVAQAASTQAHGA
jgi:hypothetical protein